jgi:hypothetical protein
MSSASEVVEEFRRRLTTFFIGKVLMGAEIIRYKALELKF